MTVKYFFYSHGEITQKNLIGKGEMIINKMGYEERAIRSGLFDIKDCCRAGCAEYRLILFPKGEERNYVSFTSWEDAVKFLEGLYKKYGIKKPIPYHLK